MSKEYKDHAQGASSITKMAEAFNEKLSDYTDSSDDDLDRQIIESANASSRSIVDQMSPSKKVKFDEKNISMTTKNKEVSQETELKFLRIEISKLTKEGNIQQRNGYLQLYCQQVNETTQVMDLLSSKEVMEKALEMLQTCIEVIEENSNQDNMFPELFYETYNNLARCMNIKGDIKGSLVFLERALENVERFAKEQESGTVTIIPEVSLNICNAHVYLDDQVMALVFAERAITSSKQCINSISSKLDKVTQEDSVEYNRLYQLFISQLNLHIQAFQAKGQAYERERQFNEAIREYNNAKRVVEKNYGTDHPMFKDLVNQISSSNVKLKQMNYTGMENKQTTKTNSSGNNQIFGGGGNKKKRIQSAKPKIESQESKNRAAMSKDLEDIDIIDEKLPQMSNTGGLIINEEEQIKGPTEAPTSIIKGSSIKIESEAVIQKQNATSIKSNDNQSFKNRANRPTTANVPAKKVRKQSKNSTSSNGSSKQRKFANQSQMSGVTLKGSIKTSYTRPSSIKRPSSSFNQKFKELSLKGAQQPPIQTLPNLLTQQKSVQRLSGSPIPYIKGVLPSRIENKKKEAVKERFRAELFKAQEFMHPQVDLIKTQNTNHSTRYVPPTFQHSHKWGHRTFSYQKSPVYNHHNYDHWHVDHCCHPARHFAQSRMSINTDPGVIRSTSGSRKRKSSKKKQRRKIIHKTFIINKEAAEADHTPVQVLNNDNSELLDQLRELREQIRQKDTDDVEKSIEVIKLQQLEQQRNVMLALERHKEMILETQQKELKQRLQQEENIIKSFRIKEEKQETKHQHQIQHQYNHHAPTFYGQGFQASNQQVPVHPQFGQAVFNYQTNQWTYPYSQYQNQQMPTQGCYGYDAFATYPLQQYPAPSVEPIENQEIQQQENTQIQKENQASEKKVKVTTKEQASSPVKQHSKKSEKAKSEMKDSASSPARHVRAKSSEIAPQPNISKVQHKFESAKQSIVGISEENQEKQIKTERNIRQDEITNQGQSQKVAESENIMGQILRAVSFKQDNNSKGKVTLNEVNSSQESNDGKVILETQETNLDDISPCSSESSFCIHNRNHLAEQEIQRINQEKLKARVARKLEKMTEPQEINYSDIEASLGYIIKIQGCIRRYLSKMTKKKIHYIRESNRVDYDRKQIFTINRFSQCVNKEVGGAIRNQAQNKDKYKTIDKGESCNKTYNFRVSMFIEKVPELENKKLLWEFKEFREKHTEKYKMISHNFNFNPEKHNFLTKQGDIWALQYFGPEATLSQELVDDSYTLFNRTIDSAASPLRRLEMMANRSPSPVKEKENSKEDQLSQQLFTRIDNKTLQAAITRMDEPPNYQLVAKNIDQPKIEHQTKIRGLRLPVRNKYLLNAYMKTALNMKVDHVKYIDSEQFQFKKRVPGEAPLSDIKECMINQVREIESKHHKSGVKIGSQIFNSNCSIIKLNLMRLKMIMKDLPCSNHLHCEGDCNDSKEGCILKLQFFQDTLQEEYKQQNSYGEIVPEGFFEKIKRQYQFKVYKRIRKANEDDLFSNRVHDWKIKVIQMSEPKTFDYLVVRRLPVPLHQLEQHLKENITFVLNWKVSPPPLMAMEYTPFGKDNVVIRSQRYWDMNCLNSVEESSHRFQIHYHNSFYFTADREGRPTPPEIINNGEKTSQPLYEVYVQHLSPVFIPTSPLKYDCETYRNRKRKMLKRKNKIYNSASKQELLEEAVVNDETDSDYGEDCHYYNNLEDFFNEEALKKIQLDEHTSQRHYYKITISNTLNKEISDQICVNWDDMKRPRFDIEYQYFMNNIQIYGENEIYAKISVRQKEGEKRWQTDQLWALWLKNYQQLEKFMAQDILRWRNQRYAVSVYCVENEGDVQYMIEAVNTDKPSDKMVTSFSNIFGLRGKILKEYIDSEFEIYESEINKEDQDGQTGFGGSIGQISLKTKPDQFISKRQKLIRIKKDQLLREQEKGINQPQLKVEFSDDESCSSDEEEEPQLAMIDPTSLETTKIQEYVYSAEAIRKEKYRLEKAQLQKRQDQADDNMTLMRAAVFIQKLFRSFKAKKETALRLKKYDVITTFDFMYNHSDYQRYKIHVIVKKYKNPALYKYNLFNKSSVSQKHIYFTFSTYRLPGNLQDSSIQEEFQALFGEKLRIIFSQQEGAYKQVMMQEAFFDQSYMKEVKNMKVVDVPLVDDKIRQAIKEQKAKDRLKAEKDKNNRARMSSSDSDASEVEEQRNIKEDIRVVKEVFKIIKKKAEQYYDKENGLKFWFDYFDTDKSDEIDLVEFRKMLDQIKAPIPDRERIEIMLFVLLDREGVGLINYATVRDVLKRVMKPNYKKIVKKERRRWEKEGVNITFNKRNRPVQIKTETRTIIKKEVVVREKFVPNYIEKINEVVVEVPVPEQSPSPPSEHYSYEESPPKKQPLKKEKTPPIPDPVEQPKPVQKQPTPPKSSLDNKKEHEEIKMLSPVISEQKEPEEIQMSSPVLIKEETFDLADKRKRRKIVAMNPPTFYQSYAQDTVCFDKDKQIVEKIKQAQIIFSWRINIFKKYKANTGSALQATSAQEAAEQEEYYFEVKYTDRGGSNKREQLLFKSLNVLFSEDFEEKAREEVRKEYNLSQLQQPTRNQMGEKIKELFMGGFNELVHEFYDPKDGKGEWVKNLKSAIIQAFCVEFNEPIADWIEDYEK